MRPVHVLRKEKKKKKKGGLGYVSSLQFYVETDQNQTDMGLNIKSPDTKALIHFKTGRDASLVSLVAYLIIGGIFVYSVAAFLSHFQLALFLYSLTKSCPSVKEGFVHDIWGWSAFPVKSIDPI